MQNVSGGKEKFKGGFVINTYTFIHKEKIDIVYYFNTILKGGRIIFFGEIYAYLLRGWCDFESLQMFMNIKRSFNTNCTQY